MSAVETGWEPQTPESDTVERMTVLAMAEGFEALARSHGGRAERTSSVSLADARSPSLFLNNVTLLRPLLGTDGDDTLDAIDRFFAAGTAGGSAVWSAWPTPDLRTRGWELAGHPPLMLRPAGGAAPPPPTGVEIVECTTGTDRAAWERVLVDGFPVPEVPLAPGCLLGSDDAPVRAWLARVDGRPVAAAGAHAAHGLALVEFVATLPEARRRGYGAAATWAATLAWPELPAVLLASDDGRPVYERMGYTALWRFTLWVRPRTPEAG